MKFRESGAASCRGYGNACLEDVEIDRSPNTGFLENCQDHDGAVPTYPSGNFWDEACDKTGSGKFPPQRHFRSRLRSRALQCCNRGDFERVTTRGL